MAVTSAIGIMCKAPQPGRTKTRLAASIGAAAAAELSACFLRDIGASVDAIPDSLGRHGYGVYAPAGAEQTLLDLFPPGFRLLLQAGENLGDVLLASTRSLLSNGHREVVLVNGDSPTLPCAFLVQAIEHMRKPGDRVVLGPASDGGYYLIGLKAPHEHLFSRIQWGTASVFRDTCERAAGLGLETTLLPEWYDVDNDETLHWLRDELDGRSARFRGGGNAPATRAYLSVLASEAR